jgi:hypothetical protein
MASSQLLTVIITSPATEYYKVLDHYPARNTRWYTTTSCKEFASQLCAISGIFEMLRVIVILL